MRCCSVSKTGWGEWECRCMFQPPRKTDLARKLMVPVSHHTMTKVNGWTRVCLSCRTVWLDVSACDTTHGSPDFIYENMGEV
jgi:hypothetical protein